MLADCLQFKIRRPDTTGKFSAYPFWLRCLFQWKRFFQNTMFLSHILHFFQCQKKSVVLQKNLPNNLKSHCQKKYQLIRILRKDCHNLRFGKKRFFLKNPICFSQKTQIFEPFQKFYYLGCFQREVCYILLENIFTFRNVTKFGQNRLSLTQLLDIRIKNIGFRPCECTISLPYYETWRKNGQKCTGCFFEEKLGDLT